MKTIFNIIGILFFSISLGQNNLHTLEFYPLTIKDEISDIEAKKLQKVDSLDKVEYFFTENYKEDYGLFLIKKENKNWIVYDYELYLHGGRNTVIKNIKEENNRFISIKILSSPTGICESNYERVILIDITQNSFTDFFTFSEIKCFDNNGQVSSSSKCKAKFSIKGNLLKIKTSKTNDLKDCIESGTYKYENQKFVKIK